MKKIFLSMLFIPVSLMSVFADGFIVLPEPHPHVRSPYPLEVKYHHVDVQIDALSAQTDIDQEFFNPTGSRLEGVYIFPVPQGAVIRKFSMFIDGKEAEAELLDAVQAHSIYEDIVRKQLDPALLEYSDRAIFKLRIFPIEPRSSKRIKISYTEILTKENGSIEYMYPLNTEKFSAKNLEDVKITVSVKGEGAVRNLYSPTHTIAVTRSADGGAKAVYSEKDVKPDADFKLYYDTAVSKVGMIFRTFRIGGEDGFFFLNAGPGMDKITSEVSEKDIAFVLDVSGSMAGEKLEQSKKALSFCIENLNKGDTFQVIRFSTEAEALFDTLSPANAVNVGKARVFIDKMKAIGGTNIEEALKLACASRKNTSRPYMIVFITDGKPTIGETNEDLLVEQIRKVNTGNIRIFTFGVGYDINTHLLDKLTEMTRAYRTYVSPKEDIELKVSNFYTRIQSPVLTDLALNFRNIKVSKSYPKELPDLFAGSSLTVFGRYTGSGKSELILEGKVKGKVQKYFYELDFPEESRANDFLPSIWATRRIGYLLDQIRLHGENKEIVDEIVSLARMYGVITPYTSYLILEDETHRTGTGEVQPEDVTLGNAMPGAPERIEEYKKDMTKMRSKSGEGSVNASSALQSMNDADNASMAKREQEKVQYKSSGGATRNITQQMKNVQGRTVYSAGKFWVDPQLQGKKNLEFTHIRFASPEYFDLLKNEPEMAQYMKLGKNVRFYFKSKGYEIAE